MPSDALQPSRAAAPLLRRVRALAAERAWLRICILLKVVRPAAPPAPVLACAVDAALATRDEAVRRWAVDHALAAPLPHRLRASMAYKLMRAGHVGEGWSVFQADPATGDALDGRGLVLAMLGWMSGSATVPPALRAQARADHQRLIDRAGLVPEATPHRLPDPGPLPPPAFPLALHLAPGVDPAAREAIAEELRTAEQALRACRAPAVRILRDVAITRFGLVRRAGTGPEDAQAPFIPAGIRAVGGTNNLYHWLAAWLPSLAWRFAPGAPADLPILLDADAHPYQQESLELLGGPDLPIARVGRIARVGALYDTEHRAIRLDPAGGIEPVIARLVAAAEARVPEPPLRAARLYISRRDAVARRMANEAALEARLAAAGFAPVMLTPYGLAEAIAIIRSADCIVAPHGAGLSYLLLARPGTAVFELMPFDRQTLAVRLCMAQISRQRGHRHLLWVERGEHGGIWRASIAEAVAALEAFLR